MSKGGAKSGGRGGGDGDAPGGRIGGRNDDGDEINRVFRDDDGDTNVAPKKNSSKTDTGLTIAKIVAGIATVIGSIFLILKLFPQAVSEAFFGWLPEKYRQPACSSCCCSCSALVVLATVGIAFSYAK